MKVKTLIQMLSKLDPDLTVVVQDYNGCDDVCRRVSSVREVQTPGLEWTKHGPPDRAQRVVFIAGLNRS